eukprot:gb/GECH01010875.1/.p1 GENE.gb/GECH01010875.1/~~gb/GECH01010875.1/.p1  ORF type:complete len:1141 (+),score=429.78 gb/GECH01010875.1/:1-3423(+)
MPRTSKRRKTGASSSVATSQDNDDGEPELNEKQLAEKLGLPITDAPKQEEIDDLLAALSHEQLELVITRLLRANPELEEQIRRQIKRVAASLSRYAPRKTVDGGIYGTPMMGSAAGTGQVMPSPMGTPGQFGTPQTPGTTSMMSSKYDLGGIRRTVRGAFKPMGGAGLGLSRKRSRADSYQLAADEVNTQVDKGKDLAHTEGDVEGSLSVLEAITDEFVNVGNELGEHNVHGYDDVLEHIAQAWVEVFLSRGVEHIDQDERKDWARKLFEWDKSPNEDEGTFSTARCAAKMGWEDTHLNQVLSGEHIGKFKEPTELSNARLDILEREKKFDEALNLAKAVDLTHRAAIFLLKLGNVKEAEEIAYELEEPQQIFTVAQVARAVDVDVAFRLTIKSLAITTEWTNDARRGGIWLIELAISTDKGRDLINSLQEHVKSANIRFQMAQLLYAKEQLQAALDLGMMCIQKKDETETEKEKQSEEQDMEIPEEQPPNLGSWLWNTAFEMFELGLSSKEQVKDVFDHVVDNTDYVQQISSCCSNLAFKVNQVVSNIPGQQDHVKRSDVSDLLLYIVPRGIARIDNERLKQKKLFEEAKSQEEKSKPTFSKSKGTAARMGGGFGFGGHGGFPNHNNNNEFNGAEYFNYISSILTNLINVIPEEAEQQQQMASTSTSSDADGADYIDREKLLEMIADMAEKYLKMANNLNSVASQLVNRRAYSSSAKVARKALSYGRNEYHKAENVHKKSLKQQWEEYQNQPSGSFSYNPFWVNNIYQTALNAIDTAGENLITAVCEIDDEQFLKESVEYLADKVVQVQSLINIMQRLLDVEKYELVIQLGRSCQERIQQLKENEETCQSLQAHLSESDAAMLEPDKQILLDKARLSHVNYDYASIQHARLMVKAATKSGDQEIGQEYAIKIFKHDMSIEAFEDIKKLCSDEEWPKKREELLKDILRKPEPKSAPEPLDSQVSDMDVDEQEDEETKKPTFNPISRVELLMNEKMFKEAVEYFPSPQETSINSATSVLPNLVRTIRKDDDEKDKHLKKLFETIKEYCKADPYLQFLDPVLVQLLKYESSWAITLYETAVKESLFNIIPSKYNTWVELVKKGKKRAGQAGVSDEWKEFIEDVKKQHKGKKKLMSLLKMEGI